jgi:hypothetical protein
MILKLLKKNDSTHKDALLVYLEDEKGIFIRKVKIGEKIEVADYLGYKIMAAYKDCFEPVGVQTKEVNPRVVEVK